MLKQILFLAVVFLSNVIQCVTGFAGTVLAMPPSIMLVGYTIAKPILNVLGIVASVGVVATNYKSINKKEFLKISAVMLLGITGDEETVKTAIAYLTKIPDVLAEVVNVHD